MSYSDLVLDLLIFIFKVIVGGWFLIFFIVTGFQILIDKNSHLIKQRSNNNEQQ
jgi:hypothetical protein